ncbi:MAG: hypothetical protein IJA15_04160, partial [Clostridia bacterium]|nr:hypothetical protein [Clostridia bacterium]
GVFGAAGGYNGTFFATDNLHGITQNCGLKVIDCYIDATKITGFAQANKARILGYNSADTSVSYVTMHGVYALVPTGCMSNGILDAEDKATELFFWFESATDMLSHSKTQREIASWSTDYWTIVDGVPVWREIQ